MVHTITGYDQMSWRTIYNIRVTGLKLLKKKLVWNISG
jgi:hypothetical protein